MHYNMKVNGKMELNMAKGPIFMLIKINTLDGGNSVKKVEKELIFTMKTTLSQLDNGVKIKLLMANGFFKMELTMREVF